jgi:hypothetical protein
LILFVDIWNDTQSWGSVSAVMLEIVVYNGAQYVGKLQKCLTITRR